MDFSRARSAAAQSALVVVEGLQERLGSGLLALKDVSDDQHLRFDKVTWLREEGRCGGGHRLVASSGATFNRGSINVSQVQYEADDTKPLNSATALSTIIHPANPHAPSVHAHISYTELKAGKSYWRIMADLNPSIVHQELRDSFLEAMEAAAGVHLSDGIQQGERYFFIPALNRHRGVLHFYLEDFNSGDFKADADFARNFGEKILDSYLQILRTALNTYPEVSVQDRAAQLAYHTLYFLQVLTLDRGTISGLLVHDENDVGIMGSLPSHVDRHLLSTWRGAMNEAQRPLLDALLCSLPEQRHCAIEEAEKIRLANAIRQFYAANPQALSLLARGDVLPTTTANHL